MRVVRRFYFYLVAFISLEVVIWGLVTLTSSFINSPVGGGLANLLARGLSQVIVGLPILWLHWRVIVGDYHQTEEERHTRVRALFLYGLKIATLAPILINLLAVIRKPLIIWMNVNSTSPPFLASQEIFDNLISIFVNLVIWFYVERILKQDWLLDPMANSLRDIRRLYRYVWLLLSIGSLVIGLEQIVVFVLNFEKVIGNARADSLANGIAVAIIAAPLWAWMTRLIQHSLDKNEELFSTLRLVVLFALTLSGVAFVLSISGTLISSMVRWLLGQPYTWIGWVSQYSSWLATLLPFVVIWSYYGRNLDFQISKEYDVVRRASLKRLYHSILALAGNVVVFTGLVVLVNLIVDLFFGDYLAVENFRNQLSIGLTCLIVGLPLWITPWLSVQKEAVQKNDLGDHARQSAVRKGYLYLVIFALVVGLMSMAGYLAFRLINSLLGNLSEDLLQFSLQKAGQLALIGLWLVYHLRVLRADGKTAQQILRKRHSDFTTLIIAKNQGDPIIDLFADQTKRQIPDLQVTNVFIDAGKPEDYLKSYSALVIAADQMASLPDHLRLWMNEFTGQIIVLPIAARKYNWVGIPNREEKEIVYDAVRILRQLAEGQPAKSGGASNAWSVASNVLAVLFLLQLLIGIVSLVLSVVLN
jgi:hypothetical protein